MTALLFLIGLTVLVTAAVVLAAVWVLLPAVSAASEGVRIQRETQEASWRIHQHAAAAFGQMLDAARQADAGDES